MSEYFHKSTKNFETVDDKEYHFKTNKDLGNAIKKMTGPLLVEAYGQDELMIVKVVKQDVAERLLSIPDHEPVFVLMDWPSGLLLGKAYEQG